MLLRYVCPKAFAASLVLGGVAPSAIAHDLPNSHEFNIVLPEDSFTGQVMFITYIGPPVGQNIWHATVDLTWVSSGGTPASNLLINFELAVNGLTDHWTLTGADLGWGSGPGIYTGKIDTHELNGLITPNGPFGSSILHVDIGTVNGLGLTGGHFDNSTLSLELAAVPAPATLAALVAGIGKSRRRRYSVL